ncbi:MAG: ATP-binding protein [Pseudomonadota bacterium]
MNLKRQLLLVSLLTLILPWAGCEFIRETETALRSGQQQMLAGTASAIAESLQQYAARFPNTEEQADFIVGNQLYAHALPARPTVDGYVNDWPLSLDSLASLPGSDGQARYVLGETGGQLYLYVEVADRDVVYGQPGPRINRAPFADSVTLVSANPPAREETIEFFAEAPGIVVAYRRTGRELKQEPAIRALWQDVPGGYQLEARIPRSILGTHLGLVLSDTDSEEQRPIRSASYASRSPGALAVTADDLQSIAADLVQPGIRLLLTDASGWRIGNVGTLGSSLPAADGPVSAWLRFAYDALVEPGVAAELADPHPSGREQQAYIREALDGNNGTGWFRSTGSGDAIVAVAEPVTSNGQVVGTVVLQRGTDDILSLRNEGLSRLLNVTLLSTFGVAAILLGYATWLSRRIRHLSKAADAAIDGQSIRDTLPSSAASDEIGDLSRSFSNVLSQVGSYNEYLRTLASKLSHELRTPLAIVTSSLDNLEHEALSETAASYTARAKDGAERLRAILNAMSEASRVEELMKNADLERFDLLEVIKLTIDAYSDVYSTRRFALENVAANGTINGSPELIVQLLDKLVDNAVSFSADDDTIRIATGNLDHSLVIDIDNPGPALPERMRGQLFDSMVSVREGADDRHLGLGLHIARLIAEGHAAVISASNIDGGVRFSVRIPLSR